MSEQFNNKDYGEYFSAVEKSLERKSKSDADEKQPVAEKARRPAKRFYGRVIRLRP